MFTVLRLTLPLLALLVFYNLMGLPWWWHILGGSLYLVIVLAPEVYLARRRARRDADDTESHAG